MLKIPKKNLIKDFIDDLPSKPGIYKFQDKKYNSIYIGKAKDLKKRVSSYFSPSKSQSEKVKSIIRESNYIDLVITKTEHEALLLEQIRIKEEKPKYNVQFKDDKGYPWIKIETTKEYPSARSFLGKKTKEDIYFGPFPSSYSVKDTLDLIQKTFKLRDCTDSTFKNRSRPCMQYQINKCSAPCVGVIGRDEYLREVEDAKKLLYGGADKLIEKFYEEMDKNSKKEAYERAAMYRDKISSLREVQRSQSIAGFSKERDAITICKNKDDIRIGLTQVRGGWITGHKNFVVKKNKYKEDLISNFIQGHYLNRGADIADIITLEKITNKEALMKSISQVHERKVKILSKISKKDAGLLAISKSNTEFSIKRAARSRRDLSDKFKSLKELLKINTNLFFIDSIDISHHSGQNPIGGVVTYNSSGRVKSECRTYNISSKNSSNDIASTKEVIERRYGNFLIKKKRLPDLLIIDGGPTHLNSVKDKLKELGINQLNVVSISKGVRRKAEYDLIHLIGHKPINLNKDDLSKLLIQEIRDETHRFAILRHRRKSMKRITKSHLDSLPGIGERRKAILLRYFGGIDQIRKASSEDIANVPGIGKLTSDLVYNSFH